MKFTKSMKVAQFFKSMAALGFSYEEADRLRLIEKTLHRWAELECGDGNEYASWAIERNEETDRPFMVRHMYGHGQTQDRVITTRVADREKGALKRLQAIMISHPELVAYQQTDPRDCALYIVKKADLNGLPIGSCYSRGFGVCVD